MELIDCIFSRKSGYSYDPEKTIAKITLEQIFSAAMRAPSCYNDQPWRYIVCQKSVNQENWEKLYSCLVEMNQKWAQNADVLVLIMHKKTYSSTTRPIKGENHWSEYDTGASAYSAMLVAHDMGVMAHQMAGFDPDSILERFSGIIPEECEPKSVMTMGYPIHSANQDKSKRRDIYDVVQFL